MKCVNVPHSERDWWLLNLNREGCDCAICEKLCVAAAIYSLRCIHFAAHRYIINACLIWLLSFHRSMTRGLRQPPCRRHYAAFDSRPRRALRTLSTIRLQQKTRETHLKQEFSWEKRLVFVSRTRRVSSSCGRDSQSRFGSRRAARKSRGRQQAHLTLWCCSFGKHYCVLRGQIGPAAHNRAHNNCIFVKIIYYIFSLIFWVFRVTNSYSNGYN